MVRRNVRPKVGVSPATKTLEVPEKELKDSRSDESKDRDKLTAEED